MRRHRRQTGGAECSLQRLVKRRAAEWASGAGCKYKIGPLGTILPCGSRKPLRELARAMGAERLNRSRRQGKRPPALRRLRCPWSEAGLAEIADCLADRDPPGVTVRVSPSESP